MEADVLTQIARVRGRGVLVTVWETYVLKMAAKVTPTPTEVPGADVAAVMVLDGKIEIGTC